MSLQKNFDSKLFVQLAAPEIMSYIKKQMEGNDLYRNYTMQAHLDEINTLEFHQQTCRAHRLL